MPLYKLPQIRTGKIETNRAMIIFKILTIPVEEQHHENQGGSQIGNGYIRSATSGMAKSQWPCFSRFKPGGASSTTPGS